MGWLNMHHSVPCPHVPSCQGWVSLRWDYQRYQDLPSPSANTIVWQITFLDSYSCKIQYKFRTVIISQMSQPRGGGGRKTEAILGTPTDYLQNVKILNYGILKMRVSEIATKTNIKQLANYQVIIEPCTVHTSSISMTMIFGTLSIASACKLQQKMMKNPTKTFEPNMIATLDCKIATCRHFLKLSCQAYLLFTQCFHLAKTQFYCCNKFPAKWKQRAKKWLFALQ